MPPRPAQRRNPPGRHPGGCPSASGRPLLCGSPPPGGPLPAGRLSPKETDRPMPSSPARHRACTRTPSHPWTPTTGVPVRRRAGRAGRSARPPSVRAGLIAAGDVEPVSRRPGLGAATARPGRRASGPDAAGRTGFRRVDLHRPVGRPGVGRPDAPDSGARAVLRRGRCGHRMPGRRPARTGPQGGPRTPPARTRPGGVRGGSLRTGAVLCC